MEEIILQYILYGIAGAVAITSGVCITSLLKLRNKCNASSDDADKLYEEREKYLQQQKLLLSLDKEYIPTLEIKNKIKIEFPKGKDPVITYPKNELKETQPTRTDTKYSAKKIQFKPLDFVGVYNFHNIENADSAGTTGSVIFNSSDKKTYKPYIYLDNKWQEIGDTCRLPYNQIEFSLKEAYYDPISNDVNLIWQHNNQVMRTKASAIIDSINYSSNYCKNSTISEQWGVRSCFKI